MEKNVKKIRNLFPNDFQHVMESAHILITKVTKGSIENEHITKMIRDAATQQMGQSPENLDIYRAILKLCDSKRVICFPIPTLIKKDDDVGYIISKVKNIPAYELIGNSHLEISSDGKILVEEFARQTTKELEVVEKIIYAKIDSRTLFASEENGKPVDKLKNELSKKNDIMVSITAISKSPQQTYQIYDMFLDSMKMEPADKEAFFKCLQDLSFC